MVIDGEKGKRRSKELKKMKIEEDGKKKHYLFWSFLM